MAFLDSLRQRNQMLDGTAAPSAPLAAGAAQQFGAPKDYAKIAQEQFGFTGWNPDNFQQYDTIMKQANDYQAGGGAERSGIRDYLQGQYNDFYNPLAASYRQAMQSRGTPADATDANLMKSADFANYARTGQLPQQTLAQQWTSAASAQPSASTATMTETSTPTYTAGTDPRRQQFFEELMSRIRANDAIPGRDNPVVRAQADAYSAQQTREMRDYLADLAESEGPNANLRGEQRMAAEMAGRNSGQFEAELIGREQDARRAQTQAMLGQVVNLLDVDSQQALQRELGLNDLDLRKAQLAQSGDEFLRELALREWDLTNRNDLIRRGLA